MMRGEVSVGLTKDNHRLIPLQHNVDCNQLVLVQEIYVRKESKEKKEVFDQIRVHELPS